MKKTIAVLLSLLLLLGTAFAVGQDIEIHREEGLFYIVVTLPDGAQVQNSMSDELFSLTEVSYSTEGMPTVMITVAADELYVGQSLSDLTSEDIDLIISEISLQMTDPSAEIRTAPDGALYIVVNESTAKNDTCDTIMLVNGYFIMVHVSYADFSELTPEDIEIGPSIIETLQFIGNTNS